MDIKKIVRDSMKGSFKRGLICLLAISMLMAPLSYAGIWQSLNLAGELEAQGDLAQALPYWIEAVEYFEGQTKDEGVYTNIALFSKKIGQYYDGIKQYEQAVYYYEKENENWNLAGKPWGAADMLRAEEIRTFYEYYVKVPVNPLESLAKYEPAAGIYNGIYSENDDKIGQDFSKTKKVYGDHAMYILYQDWNQTFKDYYGKVHPIDVTLANAMKDENASFHVAMNAMSGLGVVEKNQWLIDWAKAAKKLDMPIFLRLFGEMNGEWVPWSGDPQLYIEKFRMVHDVMEEYAPNVVMVWCPGDAPVETNEGIRIEDYYPGDAYVDWVAVNFYIDYYNSGIVTETSNHLKNPLAHLDYIYDMYADRKPIMVGETGFSHYDIPSKVELTDWAIANMEKFYLQLPIKYPRVKAVNYFSVDQAAPHNVNGSKWSNYLLSDKPEIQETYKEIMASDYYLGEMGMSLDETFAQITQYDFKDQSEIFFVVKIPDYKIDRIEFYSGDTLLGKDDSLPFSLKADFSAIDTVSLKVFNAKGNLSTVKVIDLNAIPEEATPLSTVEYHEAYVEGQAGSLLPEKMIKRSEVAMMISRLIEVNPSEIGYMAFEDMDENHWAYAAVKEVISSGIMDIESSFRPNDMMTKAELSDCLFNFANYEGIDIEKIYGHELVDVSDTHPSVLAIRSMIEYALEGSVQDGSFKPNDPVKRKDTIMMINRLTNRPEILSTENTFDDFDASSMDYLNIMSATEQQVKY